MPVYLPDKNYVTYSAEVDISEIVSQEFLRWIMLTEWFAQIRNIQELGVFAIVISLQNGDGTKKPGHGKKDREVAVK
jgi:hypothetical protein